MSTLTFTKMHGLGNNYIYVDLFAQGDLELDWSRLAVAVSDRNFGVGSDGLILMMPSDVADVGMRIFNADGSEAEMCGNGIRCVAKYVYDHGIAAKPQLMAETKAGLLELAVRTSGGVVDEVRVDMGAPIFSPVRIPFEHEGDIATEVPMEAGGVTYAVTALSMGNPHGVVFVDDVANFPVTEIGPKLEAHPAFPRKANIEFIEIKNAHEIIMRVWERGSGETLACGTGAAAAAVAAILTDRVPRHELTVGLLGGPLKIDWNANDDRVYMTGPAVEVFSGQFAEPWLKQALQS